MSQKIIVNTMPEETRMALLENGKLAEVSVERAERGHIVGNIYKGKVKNVLPGMQAAFVDISRDKNAFLYIGEVHPDVPAEATRTGMTLTTGQEIMIQIVKDAIGTKGPRATTHLTLPGRYIVLMPTVEYVGMSRRIISETERERLKELANKVRPAGMGVIVRTMAEGKSQEDLQRDVDYLSNLWNSLLARHKLAHAPALLYRDVDLVIRLVRDYLTADVEEFVLDNRDAYGRVCDLLKYSSPELIPRIHLYQGNDDIFTHYGIAGEFDKLAQRIVELKCGGYIVIDKTEALTVIDVNTGKFVGCTNLADTVFQTNLEAAEEIARQIRLRDIGGIIIIDLIDMDREEHKQAVLETLAEKLKQDRTKTNVLGFTGLGLVEMTRKKARQNLDGLLYSQCPCCDGRGRIRSPETVTINIKRELRRISTQRKIQGRLVIQAHPRVVKVLEKADLTHLGQELSQSLDVEAVPGMHDEVFSILAESEKQ